MATEHQLEVLNDALQALLRAQAAELPRSIIITTNRLLDACVEAGMAHDEADLEAWAAARVARWLVEA